MQPVRPRVASAEASPMSIQANKAVVERYLQAVRDGDLATLEALQHPEVKWWVLGVGEFGREAFLESVRTTLLAAERRSITVISMTGEEDRVAFEATSEMVFADRTYRNAYHNLLTIRDGLIVAGREYMDTRTLTA